MHIWDRKSDEANEGFMLDENSGWILFCWTLLLRVMVTYEDFIDQLHTWVFIGKSARGVSHSRCVAQGLDWCSTLPDMASGSPVPKENVQAKEAKLGAGGYESTRAPAVPQEHLPSLFNKALINHILRAVSWAMNMRPVPDSLDEVWKRLLIEPLPYQPRNWVRGNDKTQEGLIREMRAAFNYYFPTFSELSQLISLEVNYKPRRLLVRRNELVYIACRSPFWRT